MATDFKCLKPYHRRRKINNFIYTFKRQIKLKEERFGIKEETNLKSSEQACEGTAHCLDLR